jgi:chaperone BCS1
MKIEYRRANASQATDMFQRFFPASRFASFEADTTPALASAAINRKSPQFKISLTHPLPELAATFAAGIPEGEFSAAEIQGFLLLCKWDPERAVAGLSAWIDNVRAERLARDVHQADARRKRREKRAAKADTLSSAPTATGDGNLSRAFIPSINV